MAVTALVLTLSADETERRAALADLAREPGLTLGDPHGVRYPVVLDTPSSREDKKCFERIEAIEGVNLIELVSVDYDLEPVEGNRTDRSDGAGSAS